VMLKKMKSCSSSGDSFFVHLTDDDQLLWMLLPTKRYPQYDNSICFLSV
jgi:hypothetical protein